MTQIYPLSENSMGARAAMFILPSFPSAFVIELAARSWCLFAESHWADMLFSSQGWKFPGLDLCCLWKILTAPGLCLRWGDKGMWGGMIPHKRNTGAWKASTWADVALGETAEDTCQTSRAESMSSGCALLNQWVPGMPRAVLRGKWLVHGEWVTWPRSKNWHCCFLTGDQKETLSSSESTKGQV